MITCPKCNAVVADDMTECPQCGIFFSKWREREENVASGNVSRYASIANATSSGFNWTVLIIVAAAVIGVLYYITMAGSLE